MGSFFLTGEIFYGPIKYKNLNLISDLDNEVIRFISANSIKSLTFIDVKNLDSILTQDCFAAPCTRRLNKRVNDVEKVLHHEKESWSSILYWKIKK